MSEWGFMFDDTWVNPEDEDWILEEILFPLVDGGFTFFEAAVPDYPSPEREEKIRCLSEKFKLWVSVHARFVGVNFAQYHPLLRQALLQVAMEDIAFAQRLGARQIIFHAGSVNWYDVAPPDHPHSEAFNRQFRKFRDHYMQMACGMLQTITRYALSSGVFPLFENLYMPWEFPRTPEEVVEFSKLLQDTGFTLDTGHALLTGYRLEDFLALSPRHIHLHTNDGQYDLHFLPDSQNEMVQTIIRHAPQATVLVEVSPSLHQQALLKLMQNIRSASADQ